MIRALVAALILSWMGISGDGQQVAANTAGLVEPETRPGLDSVNRPELLRVIAMYEGVAKRAEAAHLSDASLVKVYAGLGGMYYDVAMFPKAEDAMRRAVVLLRQYGPQDQLAEEIGHLAELHIATGNLRQAEKEQLEALNVRASIGDPAGMALTWTDLASLYMKERQYKKAADYGQRAFAVIGDNPAISPADRIAVRQVLGSALCETHDPARAIPMAKDAVAVAQNIYGTDSLSAGIAAYILGNTYWRCGDLVDAATWLQQGTTRMKADLGWGHPVYLQAMENYARFLQVRGQTEAAAAAESEVRQAAAVVDARTLTARTSAFTVGQPK